MIQINLFTKQKQTHRQRRKKNLRLPEGKGGGGINQEFGFGRYTVLYIKQIKNKVLLYSTGNYIQYLVITYYGKESEKEYIHVYIYMYTYI